MGKKAESDKPVPPKKAMSAFFLYRQDVLEDFKAKNPELKMTQLTRMIAESWKSLDGTAKDKYEAQYKVNKQKADSQRHQYVEQYGKIERKSKKPSKKQPAQKASKKTKEK